jgi:D-alanyl-D-alanine carboxypeptidase
MSVDPPGPVRARLWAAVEAAQRSGAPSALLRVDDCRDGWSWSCAIGTLTQDGDEPVSIDTPFRIASVTKNATAALALRLVADGVLQLDTRLAATEAAEVVLRLPQGEQITLRHLLAHTSGLVNYSFDGDFRQRLMSDPGRPWTPAELLTEICRVGNLGAPGERFSYSDSGYVVAGLIIERALGLPLHAALREYVFDPIGMDATWLEGHDEPRGRALAHHYDGQLDLSEITPTWDWAGGGLVSTLADLTRYTRETIRDGVQPGSPFSEMRSWTPDVSFPSTNSPHYKRYGLGLGKETFADTDLLGHTGFIGSFIWWSPERDLVLVGTHNRRDVDPRSLIQAVVQAVSA